MMKGSKRAAASPKLAQISVLKKIKRPRWLSTRPKYRIGILDLLDLWPHFSTSVAGSTDHGHPADL